MTRWRLGLLAGALAIPMFVLAQNGPAVTTDSALPAMDASAETPKPAAPSATPAKTEKKRLGLTFGVNERFRLNSYNNMDSTSWLPTKSGGNDEVRDFRFRTQLWLNIPFGQNVDGFVQMANETVKKLINLKAPYNGSASPMVAGEIWFDQAYMKFKKLPIPGLTLQAGRWNLMEGDGWFLGDGTASNGGRDYFFTAFDLGYQIPNTKSKIDIIGIMNPRWDDQFPVFNGRNPSVPGQGGCTVYTVGCNGYTGTFPSVLNDVDTDGLVAYYTNRSSKKRDIDLYYAFSKEYNFGLNPDWNPVTYSPAYILANPKASTNKSAYLYQPDRHLSTLGERIVFKLPHAIILNEEFAYQIGTQDTMGGLYPKINIRAWGSYGHLTKFNPDMKLKPYIRFKWWLASGADPKNPTTDGNFDPNLGGRYNMNPGSMGDPQYGYSGPMWWNLLTQNMTNEITNSAFYPANMKTFGPEIGFTPIKNIQLILDYKWVGSMNPWSVNPAHFGISTAFLPARYVAPVGTTLGTKRFDQFGMNVKWTTKIGLSGTIMYEYAAFGSYYNPSYRDGAFFFRNEINYKWSGFIPFTKKSQM